jgi:hypothetical protein
MACQSLVLCKGAARFGLNNGLPKPRAMQGRSALWPQQWPAKACSDYSFFMVSALPKPFLHPLNVVVMVHLVKILPMKLAQSM